jgi:hypothetical protein
MPLDVAWLCRAFPFSSPVSETRQGIRESIISLLPPVSVARSWCDIYFRHAAWMCVTQHHSIFASNDDYRYRYTPIAETDFYDTIFVPIYEQDARYRGPTGSHSLAVLYMALALGTLLDLDRPAHCPESKQFYQLARAALTLDSVLEAQSIPAIQALVSRSFSILFFLPHTKFYSCS